jgi:uncharacterized protein DUF3179
MAEAKIRVYWAAFVAFVIAGVGLFMVPAFIIRPFKYQSPTALHVALVFRQLAGTGTIVAACAVFTLMWLLWGRARLFQRIAMVLAGLLVLGAATMARLNYFEWMFHPVAQPGFLKADDVKLDASEMVLALDFNGEARAYPIREMAYHHIVNDEVGGVPVAVTY